MYRVTVRELFPLEDKYKPNCEEVTMLIKRVEGNDLDELLKALLEHK